MRIRLAAPSRPTTRRRSRFLPTKPLTFGFPTSISGTRTILDQFGVPWLAIGDTAASAIAQLTNAEQDQYLTDRAAKGFRLVWVNAPEHFFADSAPNDILGNAAFTGTAYQSTLNEAYWTRVDRFVRKAETLGVTCLMFPCYLGFTGTNEGWDDEMAAASNAQVAAVGTALGNRYKNSRNIMWVAGADTNSDATHKDRVDNMMAAIHAVAPQLITGHQSRGTSANTTWGSYSWLTVNSAYTDGTLVTDIEGPYADSPTRPAIYIEGRAEFETGYTATLGRQELWSPMVEGYISTLMINNPMWFFGSTTGAGFGTPPAAYDTWQEALDSPLSLDAQRLATFIGTYTPANWRLLTPGVALVTTGEGTTTTKAGIGADTANGRAVAYFPSSRSITLDLSVFTPAALHLDWFDPTNATVTSIGTYANTAGRTVTYPSANSAGDNDWVLVISPAASLTVNVGQATETDSSATLTMTKTVTLGQATETDSSSALASSKILNAGLPVESDSTAAIAASKTLTAGLPAEVDSSSPAAFAKIQTLGLPVETDTSSALTATSARVLGLATETDSSSAATLSKVLVAGEATEVDSANSISAAKAAPALGLSTETDTSSVLAPTKVITLGIAIESDIGLPLASNGGVSVGQATETDSALALSATKSLTLGLAIEVDSASPAISAKSLALAQAAEADGALTLVRAKVVTLGFAVEVDSALALILPSGPATDHIVADALYVGTSAVDRAYVGDRQVWP